MTPTTAPWRDDEFKLAINMAGAISAGAYTAGVLDFLMEALEAWQAAKDALRTWIANPVGPRPPLVPLHDVSIAAFTGASAGGMCAAIASVMVQQDFVPIHTAREKATNNTFYESWVNEIDISELLKTGDLADGRPLVSLLDCTILDTLAKKALAPTGKRLRPYISPRLTLFLTLTNVRGVPYPLYTDAGGTDEFTEYFGDRLRFESTDASLETTTPRGEAASEGHAQHRRVAPPAGGRQGDGRLSALPRAAPDQARHRGLRAAGVDSALRRRERAAAAEARAAAAPDVGHAQRRRRRDRQQSVRPRR